MTDRQVLVVGGGVEALTTAAFLRHGGLSPVVVTPEDDEDVSDQDVVLWSTAVSLLAELGVAEVLLGDGTPIREWHLHRADTAPERLSSAHDERCPCAVVDRARLRERLRECLPVGSVRLSKTPQRLDTTESGLRVVFEDGVRERFDAVVGADGTNSWVRGAHRDAFSPAQWGTTEWRVLSDGLVDAPATVTDAWTTGALLISRPSGRSVFVTPTRDAVDSDAARRTAAGRLSELFDRVDRFESVPVPALGERDRHLGVSSDRWAAGRVGLVGTAARSLPPALSLGPSLAIEDGYVLAAELTDSRPTAGALNRYARRRRHRFSTLDRDVPIRTASPETQRGAAAVRTIRTLRAAVVRSFFARRTPAVSAAVAAHL